ncbi:hypothetical protein HOLleu_20100 [Holothuria leucospilota]|uniref:LRAT domain-containing protein n=1 Tax=Holothuria leucospilota TaxID=206669 RepID=A0A9Q1H8F9_HOLLE|nr:hypothetical protein HOLleu_20100 [Holothuria leucospilota]
MKKNQEYDLVRSNFSGNTCSVPMEETKSQPPSSLGMEPNAVDMPDSAYNKTESSEEKSVTSPDGKDESGAEVEMEHATNKGPESEERISVMQSDGKNESGPVEVESSTNKSPKENETPGPRTAIGAVLSNWRIKVDHEDKLVDSIQELAKGDHIVLSGWTLHPRCHGIVVDTNIEKNELRLVRFTYEKGVIEEWKQWEPPIYKTKSPPPSSLGMEPSAVVTPDSANSKTESSEEKSVTSPDGKDESGAEVEMEHTTNKGPESEERISLMQSDGKNESGPVEVESSTNKSPEEKEKEEDRPDEMTDSANINSYSSEEGDDEFYDVDEYNDTWNVNLESVKMENETPGPRTAIGAVLSNWRIKVDHEDKLVDSIQELAKGDHIVLSGWTLHPRCHSIVVDTNIEKNELRLVRFTYEKGVIEEWKQWEPPIYKVTRYYIGDKSISSKLFDTDVVIKRARSRINNDRLTYNIRTNNCKTFARWCKTGATPAGEFGYD